MFIVTEYAALKLTWFDTAFHNLSELTTLDNLSPGHVLVIVNT